MSRKTLYGLAVSPGIGIGRVVLFEEPKLTYTPHKVKDAEAELNRYRDIREQFCHETRHYAELLMGVSGTKQADILMGHVLMVQDPVFVEEIEGLIGRDSICAENAVETVCETFLSMFLSSNDELTRQRAEDVRDIRDELLRLLLGVKKQNLSALPPNTILVADDLTPSITASMDRKNVHGIVTRAGSRNSHTAILARALEIPGVLSVRNIAEHFYEGQTAIVDGLNGCVLLEPDSSQVAEYGKKARAYQKERRELDAFLGKPTETADGDRLMLTANINSVAGALQAVNSSAEGVGLFRTEYLYMDRDTPPDEEEQFNVYKQAALILQGRPLTIRTLDIGGDKEIPCLGMEKETNPYLGFRAVRFSLKRKEIFKIQLRALLRASMFGTIRILIPLVTGIAELRETRAVLDETKAELMREGISFSADIPVGVMMETAAASLMADLFAREADFFSIGTNDLTQYTMSADRGNAEVAQLCSHYDPAVLRSIRHIVQCGQAEDKPVGICGEAAADPLMIPLLIAFGIKAFSVSPSNVLSTRKEISLWGREDAETLTRQAMRCETEEEVRRLLETNRKL